MHNIPWGYLVGFEDVTGEGVMVIGMMGPALGSATTRRLGSSSETATLDDAGSQLCNLSFATLKLGDNRVAIERF